MFTVTLFIIAKIWKQHKCPLTDECSIYIHNRYLYIIYIYTTEYNSAIKKNKIMSFTATWKDLEITILSEVSQTEKDKYHVILLYVELKKIQLNLLTKHKQIHRHRK